MNTLTLKASKPHLDAKISEPGNVLLALGRMFRVSRSFCVVADRKHYTIELSSSR